MSRKFGRIASVRQLSLGARQPTAACISRRETAYSYLSATKGSTRMARRAGNWTSTTLIAREATKRCFDQTSNSLMLPITSSPCLLSFGAANG